VDEVRVDISISDPAELAALERRLGQGHGVRVQREATGIEPGSLGLPDLLVLFGGGSTVVGALKMLPDFIRSRRSDVRVEVTVNGEHIVIDAKNADKRLQALAERIADSAIGD
jgi:hypothetical protein